MSIGEEDINDSEMKYTGHSPNLLLLENSNCSKRPKNLVAVFILEFRRVSLLPGVNMLLLLLLCIDVLLTPGKATLFLSHLSFRLARLKSLNSSNV